MSTTQTPETQQTDDQSLNFSSLDFDAMFGLQDETTPESETPAETTEEAESTPDPETPPEEKQDPDESTEAKPEEGEQPETPLNPDDPLDGMIDELINGKKEGTTTEAPPEGAFHLPTVEKEVSAFEAKIKHAEQVLAQANPLVNPDGSKLHDYKLDNGASLYEITRDELNSVIVQLQNNGQAVLADDVKRAYDQFQNNKAGIEKFKVDLETGKTNLATAKEQIDWKKAENRWIESFKRKGIEITPEHIGQIEKHLEAKYTNSPDYAFQPKDQQIFEALKESGLMEKLIKKAPNPAAGKTNPDAGVSQKTVSGSNSKRLPAGYEYSESQIKAMSAEEFDRQEAAITKAMLAGKIHPS